jgi:hypothetical protein
MLGRNPQSSKNGTCSIVCSVKRAIQGGSIAQSNGFGTTGYAKVRDGDSTAKSIRKRRAVTHYYAAHRRSARFDGTFEGSPAKTQSERPDASFDVLLPASLYTECDVGHAPRGCQKPRVMEDAFIDRSVVVRDHRIDARLATPVKEASKVYTTIGYSDFRPIDYACDFSCRQITKDMFCCEIPMGDHWPQWR